MVIYIDVDYLVSRGMSPADAHAEAHAHGDPHVHIDPHHDEPAHASRGTYWIVAAVLGVITAIEVAIFYVPAIKEGGMFIPALLALSLLKFMIGSERPLLNVSSLEMSVRRSVIVPATGFRSLASMLSPGTMGVTGSQVSSSSAGRPKTTRKS